MAMTVSFSTTVVIFDYVQKINIMENQKNSWAEMVKSIERNKRELSWNPAEIPPVQRVSLFEVRTNNYN